MKQLGFGCMRLPLIPGSMDQVDLPVFAEMVDAYMASGCNYFDTAHVYLGGNSETALRECLVRRYPRDSFLLTDKLSGSCFNSEEEIYALFETELAACGVEYFDYYLMHSQTGEVYEKFLKHNAYDAVRKLRDSGKIRHFGISFHDKPQVLRRILTEQPDIEVVQIQLNYLDIDSPSIESGAVYEVCREFGKPVFVMEPVRGGALAALPEAGAEIVSALGTGSPASLAIRYAMDFPQVRVVLSGMSTQEQMADNLRSVLPYRPLTEGERQAIADVRAVLKAENAVPCTGCRYCVAGCPRHILIPDLFSCLNTRRRYHDWGSDYYYSVHTRDHGRASDCISCGKCRRICPQHLDVPELMRTVAAEFESSN